MHKGQLRTYFTFKNIFKKETYLDVINDFDLRKTLTQFRVSAHRLAIESGRYRNIESNKRICKFCSLNLIEDENHFLLECPLYSNDRNVFLDSVSSYNSNFKNMHNEHKFIWLLSCEDIEICFEVAKFIRKCFTIRNNHNIY